MPFVRVRVGGEGCDCGAQKGHLVYLHHQRRIGRRRDTTGSEVHDGKTTCPGALLDEIVGRHHVLGGEEEFVVVHAGETTQFATHASGVSDGLHHIARSRLTLCVNILKAGKHQRQAERDGGRHA